MHRFLITFQPIFFESIKKELRNADPKIKVRHTMLQQMLIVESDNDRFMEQLGSGSPVFVQHIIPVNEILKTIGVGKEDLPLIVDMASNLAKLEKGEKFAVQCKCIGTNFDYNAKDVEVVLGRLLEEQGGIAQFKEGYDPERKVLFVVILGGTCYMSFTLQRLTLNYELDEHRIFSRKKAAISRAEFKLIEALREFGIHIQRGRAIDIGAAPGGWSYVLAKMGLDVTAVDPAKLSDKVTELKNVKHVKSRFSPELVDGDFDIAVNDMNIPAKESSEIMNQIAPRLKKGAFAIMTLKITTRNGSKHIEIAKKILSQRYDVLKIRSLFHNRMEVTMLLKVR
jgi:23S rRNA (cytidine2498-2'-O)-methyltransferase